MILHSLTTEVSLTLAMLSTECLLRKDTNHKSSMVAPIPFVAPVVTVSIVDPRENEDGDEEDEVNAVPWNGVGCPCRGHAYSNTRCFRVNVHQDGVQVGSITAAIIDRPSRVFLAACDSESQDLQEVSCTFFGRCGAPRFAPFKLDAEANEGGFLYISEFDVRVEETATTNQTEVPFLALERFFELPGIDGCWTACVYICDPCATMSKQEKHHERFGYREERSPEEDAAHTVKCREGRSADARPFLRAGFAEAEGILNHLYSTSTMRACKPLLSHEEALAVPLTMASVLDTVPVEESAPPPLSAQDEELKETVLAGLVQNPLAAAEPGGGGGAVSMASFLARVDQLVASGASLDNACVLQCAAANNLPPVVLSELVHMGASVNHVDASGLSALMVAAGSAGNKCSVHSPYWDASAVTCLLSLGADKGLVDHDGMTALGRLYSAARSMNNFRACFFPGSIAAPDPRLVALLMPPQGLTPADEEAADEGKYEGED